MTKTYECEAYAVRCFLSGPIPMIEQCCREFVLDGLCLTVTPTKYIFTWGEETGAIIELIRYPKYPDHPDAEGCWDKMCELAAFILDNTHQGSYTVQDHKRSITYDRRT